MSKGCDSFIEISNKFKLFDISIELSHSYNINYHILIFFELKDKKKIVILFGPLRGEG